jgi:hypothetical protein
MVLHRYVFLAAFDQCAIGADNDQERLGRAYTRAAKAMLTTSATTVSYLTITDRVLSACGEHRLGCARVGHCFLRQSCVVDSSNPVLLSVHGNACYVELRVHRDNFPCTADGTA